MGFSSYNCLGCGYSIRSTHACRSPESLWMVYATMVLPSGLPLSGYYDGYGRIVTDAEREEEVEVPRDKQGRMRSSLYHTTCWKLLQRPGYTVPSPRAEDQGFFCESFPTEPKTRAALAKMQRTADAPAAAPKRTAAKKKAAPKRKETQDERMMRRLREAGYIAADGSPRYLTADGGRTRGK